MSGFKQARIWMLLIFTLIYSFINLFVFYQEKQIRYDMLSNQLYYENAFTIENSELADWNKIDLGRRAYGLYIEITKEVTSLAEEFGIGHLLDKKIDTLSGGEQQRVAICRAIIKKPDIILADEPTASLDDDNEALVLRLFQVMKKQGCSIVIATHDDKISDICDQVYVIKDHQLVPMAY